MARRAATCSAMPDSAAEEKQKGREQVSFHTYGPCSTAWRNLLSIFSRCQHSTSPTISAGEAAMDVHAGCAPAAQAAGRSPGRVDVYTAPLQSAATGGSSRWRVHRAAAAYGTAAALVALSCAVELLPAPARAGRQHGTQLLQWFGLAQGMLDEGRAPDAGSRMARTLGVREGTIPKACARNCLCVDARARAGEHAHPPAAARARTHPHLHTPVDHRAAQMPSVLQNPRLSAAAMARAMGTSLHPLLDESGDQDADRSEEEPAPAWVREDLGETSERRIHRDEAAATAAFIEHQRAVAQTRWAMALGLKVGQGSSDTRMPSPEEQAGSVDLSQAPAWVRKDYEPEALPSKQQAKAAKTLFPSEGERWFLVSCVLGVGLGGGEVGWRWHARTFFGDVRRIIF